MRSQVLTPSGEAAIWARLIESQEGELTPEAAKYLLTLRFSDEDQARVQDLADRSQEGTLSEDDMSEFDRYLRVGNLLAVVQSKARLVIDRQAASSPRS
jgi:hypothetical protein